MTGKELLKMGFPHGPAVGAALRLFPAAEKALGYEGAVRELQAVRDNPVQNATHEYFGDLATALRFESEPAISRAPRARAV